MHSIRNAILEAEIVRTDEPEAYRVFADWLIEHGDPHGELIAVDLAREQRPLDVALATARDVLLYKHREQWLGELPAQTHVSYRWRRGYIDAVTIDCVDRDFPSAWHALRALPIAMWMRSLQVNGEVGGFELADALFATPPIRLATLHIGMFGQSGNRDDNRVVLDVDQMIDPLAATALLRQLRVLDLSQSAFSTAGARRLIDHAAAYRHLECIDLSECGLVDPAMGDQLRAQLPRVRFGQ